MINFLSVMKKNKEKKIGLISSFHKYSQKYHKKCLESILNQNYKNFTFYMFADKIDIKPPKSKNIRINFEYISDLSPREIKARGIIKAYNDGCDYISFIDSDDTMNTNRIEIIVNYFNQNLVDIFIHNFNTIDSRDNLIKSNIFNLSDEFFTNRFYWDKNNAGFGNTVYNSKLLYRILPFPKNSYSLDWEIIFILSLSNNIYTLDESLTNYRQHKNNWIGINNIKNDSTLKRIFYIRNYHYKSLKEYFTEREDKKGLRIIKRLERKWEKEKKGIINNLDDYLKKLIRNKDNLIWQELL